VARGLVGIAIAVSVAASPTLAHAATKVHLLVIGNNQPFAAHGGDATLPVLHFADDDAAAFYDLLTGIADSGHLLTVLDGETQTLYPGLASKTRSPTMVAVRGAVAELAGRITDNRAHGHRTIVYVFFSGHGALHDSGGPALALLDGGITQQILYDEILGKLPADYVHLFVDACHAEAVVRPRDVEARPVHVPQAQADAFLVRSTLARFPHVGAIVAATSDAQAHEWDLLRQGVFTHELLSALRGAADVNQDGRIEYSEIYAFLASANRGVGNPHARLAVVARPPEQDRHIAVLDLADLPATSRLVGVPADAGFVQIEDAAGRRIASLRGEPGYVADLVVPPGPIYVRAGDREARVEMTAARRARFDTLTFHRTGARARGALEDAVSRGLFASEFGRGYYLGFIDQAPDFASVSFPVIGVSPPGRAGSEGEGVARSPFIPARALLGVGTMGSIASNFGAAAALRIGAHAAADGGLALALDLSGSRALGASEWKAVVSGGWLVSAHLGPVRGWAGALIGGGIVVQAAPGQSDRSSGVVAGGPVAGVAWDVSRHLGFWSELKLSALGLRLDDKTAFALEPAAFVGASFGP
jgi:hypothetical protein